VQQSLDEEKAGETAADDQHTASRYTIEGTKDARERLRESSGRIVDALRERNCLTGADTLGEAAGDDGRGAELLARRFAAGPAALAAPAGKVVDERDSASVSPLGDDLVAEHRPLERATDLLDVRSAQAAGANADELPRSVGLRQVSDRGLPDAV
jgi:hypothetical protein